MAKLEIGKAYLSRAGTRYRVVEYIFSTNNNVVYAQDDSLGVLRQCTKGNFQFRYPTICSEEKQREIDKTIEKV